MGFNLTTDDVWDERESMGMNKVIKKPKIEYMCVDNNGVDLFSGFPQKLGSLVQKHFGKTARFSKRGRWRVLLNENNYTLRKL